jgi:hypothetical protein
MYEEGYRCHSENMYKAIGGDQDRGYHYKSADDVRRTATTVERWNAIIPKWKRADMSGYTRPAHEQDRPKLYAIPILSQLLSHLLGHPAIGIRCVQYEDRLKPGMITENRIFETPALQDVETARERGVVIVARQLMHAHQAACARTSL